VLGVIGVAILPPPYANAIVQLERVATKANHSALVLPPKALFTAVWENVAVFPVAVVESAFIMLVILAFESSVLQWKSIFCPTLPLNSMFNNEVQFWNAPEDKDVTLLPTVIFLSIVFPVKRPFAIAVTGKSIYVSGIIASVRLDCQREEAV
jgi:hypothetical protein